MIKKLLALALLVCIPAASYGLICEPCNLNFVGSFPTDNAEPVAIAFSTNPNCRLLVAALVAPTGSSLVAYPINLDCSLNTDAAITLPNTLTNGAYQTVAFSPDGSCLAAGDSLGNVTMFEVTATDGTCTFAPAPLTPFASGGDNITKVAFSPDSRCLATANYSSNSVSLFNINPATCVLTPVGESPFSTGSIQPTSIAFSNDGNALIATNNVLTSPTERGSISIFCVERDPVTGTCTGLSTPLTYSQTDAIQTPELAVFSPQNNCLAIANGLVNCTGLGVALYSTTGSCVDLIGSPPVRTQLFTDLYTPAVAFSPVGNCLAAVDTCNNRVLVATTSPEACSGQLFQEFSLAPQREPRHIAFSPTAECLAVANRTNSISMFRTNIILPPTIAIEALCGAARVTGTTTPGASVQVFANGAPVGAPIEVGPTGTFDITVPLDPGAYIITAQVTSGTCIVESNAVAVNIVNLTGLTFSVMPGCIPAIMGSVTVNPANTPVTIRILVDGELIAGPATVNPVNGVATFRITVPSILTGQPITITVEAQVNDCIISAEQTLTIQPVPCNFGAVPNFALCPAPCPPKPCK